MLRGVICSAIVSINSLSQKGFALPAHHPMDTRRMVYGGPKLWVFNDCARQQEARADPPTQGRSAASSSLLLLPSNHCPSLYTFKKHHLKQLPELAFRDSQQLMLAHHFHCTLFLYAILALPLLHLSFSREMTFFLHEIKINLLDPIKLKSTTNPIKLMPSNILGIKHQVLFDSCSYLGGYCLIH